MPIYTYRCKSKKCRATGTAFRSIAERDRCPRCSQCKSATEKILTATSVSVFTPYRAVAFDKDSGKAPLIKTQAEHSAFLRRNGYEEVGTDKSMAPPTEEEALAKRAQRLRDDEEARNQPVFDFNEDTHEAQLTEATP